MKTAEEILKPFLFDFYDTKAVSKGKAIEAMEEYANQFKQPQIPISEDFEVSHLNHPCNCSHVPCR